MANMSSWYLILCTSSLLLFKLRVPSGVTAQDEDSMFLEDRPAIYPSMRVKVVNHKEINCERFSDYASNCAMNAALMYNSNKKSPPTPKKIHDWCRAIKYLTNCAIEWNMDCRDVTDSHFNEESLNGHSYVVHNICDDKNFIEKYMEISKCVEDTAPQWELCYTTFKSLVDGFKKNTSSDWTHYETHFHLCCGRARFRRCVLDIAFSRNNTSCTHNQAVTLQKFSVIVSEGDVYQDCDFNMIYKNCPGGDPRPPHNSLSLGQVDDLPNDSNEFELFHHGKANQIILITNSLYWCIFLIVNSLLR